MDRQDLHGPHKTMNTDFSVVKGPRMVVADPYEGKLHDAASVSLADKILAMKRKGKTWEIIDEMVSAWIDKNDGREFAAFKAYLNDAREVQQDKKFGRTKNQDQDRRYVLSMPQELMFMIRSIFKPTELIMDTEFFIDFAKRYPVFRIPDKL